MLSKAKTLADDLVKLAEVREQHPSPSAGGIPAVIYTRYAVFRIKKSGGMTEIVDVHDSRNSADHQADELSDDRSPYRFTVMPVTVAPNEPEPATSP
jgi:hypothetical protein